MTVKGGTNQACAACKYQRRKCSSDCQLAPYFPPDQPKMFQNAHKLFGVSNIIKALKPLLPEQKKEAMRSIIFHANIRDRSPVFGVCGIINDLEIQIQQATMELEAVNAQLALCKQHQYNQSSHNSPSSELQLGQGSPSALPLFQQSPTQQPFHDNSLLSNNNFSDYNPSPDDANIWFQQQSFNNTYSPPIQSQFLTHQEFPKDNSQEYDEEIPGLLIQKRLMSYE